MHHSALCVKAQGDKLHFCPLSPKLGVEGEEMRSIRAYILLELGELLGLIVLIVVLAQFISIPLWLAFAIPAGKLLKFILVYPAARRSISQPAYTGLESLVGEHGPVVDPLDPEGYVKLRGELWRARSDGTPIPAGVEVEVWGIDGTKLLVRPRGFASSGGPWQNKKG